MTNRRHSKSKTNFGSLSTPHFEKKQMTTKPRQTQTPKKTTI